jgi:hypothetical protein
MSAFENDYAAVLADDTNRPAAPYEGAAQPVKFQPILKGDGLER